MNLSTSNKNFASATHTHGGVHTGRITSGVSSNRAPARMATPQPGYPVVTQGRLVRQSVLTSQAPFRYPVVTPSVPPQVPLRQSLVKPLVKKVSPGVPSTGNRVASTGRVPSVASHQPSLPSGSSARTMRSLPSAPSKSRAVPSSGQSGGMKRVREESVKKVKVCFSVLSFTYTYLAWYSSQDC